MPLTTREKNRRFYEKRCREIAALPPIACECGCGTMIPALRRDGKPARFVLGHQCAKGDNPKWRGGRVGSGSGYVRVLVGKDHPMASRNGYVSEHRLVMAQHLGRMLSPEEVIHHINEDKADNRIENLMLFPSHAAHLAHHVELRRLARLAA